MSISNLLAQGRQSDINVHANTVLLAPLLSADRTAISPNYDGTLCYDAEVGSLFVREVGQWDKVQTTPSTGPIIALFGPTIATTVPISTSGNVCTTPTPNNATAPILSGGITVSTSGVCNVPRAGFYRVYAQLSYNFSVAPTNGSITLTIRDTTGAIQYFKAQVSQFAAGDTTARQDMISVYGIVYLNANQTLAMYVGNTTTTVNATLNIGAIGTGPLSSYMTVEAV